MSGVEGNPDWAERMKRARLENDWTLDEAADRSGVSSRTWFRIEKGKPARRLTYSRIEKALNPLGVGLSARNGNVSAAPPADFAQRLAGLDQSGLRGLRALIDYVLSVQDESTQ